MKTTIKSRIKKTLAGIAIAGAIAFGSFNLLSYLARTSCPRNCNGEPIATLQDIYNYANTFHGGVKKQVRDKDFDNDGINDSYLECRDKTIFHTKSRNLVSGIDNPDTGYRVWYVLREERENE